MRCTGPGGDAGLFCLRAAGIAPDDGSTLRDLVIPAKAGDPFSVRLKRIPAFAGMTVTRLPLRGSHRRALRRCVIL
jgi:hypothetical protein